MKTLKNILMITAVTILSTTAINAQKKLGKFGGLTEKKIGPKTIKVPYTDVVSYKGFVKPGNEDEVKDGKKFYYLYV